MASRRGETAALGTGGRFAFHDRSDRDDSGALVTSAINRSLLAGAGTGTSRAAAPAGILVPESRRGRRRALAIVFRDKPEVIGCDGGPDSDDEDEAADGDDDELAEPSEVLSPEDRTFRNLTKRNTDFNSINSNLTGASRTLVDWVDENDRTTERSALTGRHKKFTPVVSVAPFSTGRGPGPLKINPVAPMQNGEVVSTGRIQEMVEKRGAADRVAKQQVTRLDKVTRLDDKVTRLDDKVTRLDDKVTRLDDKVTRLDNKVTRLDDKDEKVTRLDDNDTNVTRLDEKVLKPDEKVTQLDGRVTKLDDKVIRPDKETEKTKSSAKVSDEVTNEKNSAPTSVKTKTISAVKTTDVKPSSNTGSKSVPEVTSQLKAGLGSHVSGTGNVEPLKPVQRQPTADRSRNAAVESGDGGGEPASPDPPMSNIDMIKARLAEKAAQKGPASWRSPGKHPERNRARLNSLDGVPKSPKPRTHRSAAEGASVTGGEADTSRPKSVSRAGDPASSAASRTPACDRVSEPSTPQPAGGDRKNEPPAGLGTERQHLSDRERSAGTDGAEAATTAACDEEKLAAVGVKPAPGDHKPPIVNDRPKLAAKPGKVKASGQPAGWDGGGRRLSREVGVAQSTPASPKTAEGRDKAAMGNKTKSYAETDQEKPTVNLSEHPTELEKPHSRLTKGLNEEVVSHEPPVEDSQSKSSYSPQSSMHKQSETKTSVVETKAQRALKREKELERQREELEKRNRDEKKASAPSEPDEKKASAPSEPVRTERRPSMTPQETEPSATSITTRRDSPPSVDVPPPAHTSNGNGSGLYAQINQTNQRRVSRDSGPPPRPAPQVTPPSEPRAEPPPPTASQRSSFSTEDEDEEEDEPPVPLKRTVSVSPRSRRKRGGGVSFAPDTEDPRPSGVKPRSQSMPRPSALDARLSRDEAGRGGRFSGGGGGDERRSRRDEPRSRARFSLKKFLKFGRDEKRKEKDQVYGEFRAKPEIIHPIDRAGVGCVQVIGRPCDQRRREEADQRRREEADQRHRRERLAQDATTGHDSATTMTPPRLPERHSHPTHHGHPTHPSHPGHASHRISSGLTPEGRPKPPPPPPPSSCRQSGDLTPPTRPPPPNQHLLSRSRDGWARPPDTDYANLGVSRAGLTPKKPGRGARSRERAEGSSSDQRAAPLQAAGPEADQDALRRQHPFRLSLREAPACAPPVSLADSYDAVTASNRTALRQLWDQMSRSGSVPAPLLPLQVAPLSLRDFQVSPRSLLAVGRHMFVAALHGGQQVALCLTAGPMAPAPLSVPAVADFTDSVPTRLLAGADGEDGAQTIGTVHVIPAAQVQPLSAALTAPPVASEDVTSHTAWLLLLLQTVQQLQLLAAAGQQTVDAELSQLVVLTADWLPQPRLAAVLTPPADPPADGGLSPCVAALSVLLRLLGVSAATQRARDGRGVSSVPDGPAVTTYELLASLLQRDDAASLRRAAAVLGCLLWAPTGLAPAEAPRWLHRERAALLGAAVRTQPLAGDEMLRLGFLAETEAETVADALELIDI